MDGCSFVEWAIRATYDGDRCPECPEQMREMCSYLDVAVWNEYSRFGWLCHIVTQIVEAMEVEGVKGLKAEIREEHAKMLAKAKQA